jgi:hypothetical protein
MSGLLNVRASPILALASLVRELQDRMKHSPVHWHLQVPKLVGDHEILKVWALVGQVERQRNRS